MDNHTFDGLNNFYFTPENSTAFEQSVSDTLSNITCVIINLVLILFIVVIFMVFRRVGRGQDIPIQEALMMARIQSLRNEMNPSVLRTPEDPNSNYMMKNNATPNNTSVHGPISIDYEFVNYEME